MSGKLLTIREAAALLRVSYGTIRNAVLAGKLRAYRFGTRGGTYRIAAVDLDAFMEASQATSALTSIKQRPTSHSAFKHLDGARLLDAWRQQGVVAAQPDARSAPSSALSCDPSARTTS